MKKPKLSRKRCSPLPDIYTLFDKTSVYFLKKPGTAKDQANTLYINKCH